MIFFHYLNCIAVSTIFLKIIFFCYVVMLYFCYVFCFHVYVFFFVSIFS
jgi:hypothetical protein